MTGVEWFSKTIEFPFQHEPNWCAQVERWYQLDAPAFALTEAYWLARAALGVQPRSIFLASPGGSNATDAQFVSNPSPARFVHTLPNIRGASVLQVMKWSGPVFCIQKDPQSVLTGLAEGMHMAMNGEGPIWVLAAVSHGKSCTGHIFTLSANSLSCALKIGKNAVPAMEIPVAHDNDLFHWLNAADRARSRFIAPGLELEGL